MLSKINIYSFSLPEFILKLRRGFKNSNTSMQQMTHFLLFVFGIGTVCFVFNKGREKNHPFQETHFDKDSTAVCLRDVLICYLTRSAQFLNRRLGGPLGPVNSFRSRCRSRVLQLGSNEVVVVKYFCPRLISGALAGIFLLCSGNH